MSNNQSATTPAEFESLIQPDVRWFKIALERGLYAEAAELVLDWVEYWNECQRAQQDANLAAIHRTVMTAGEAVIPFIAAFAVGTFVEEEWNFLVHWLELMPMPAARSAADGVRQKRFVRAEVIAQACHLVYDTRQRDAHVIQHRRACEEGLRQLLGGILNHGMSGGLMPVTEHLSLLAREVFFRELQRKRTLAPASSDKDNPLLQRIQALFPFSPEETLRKQAFDSRWLQKMIYTFYRLAQFWLLRPLQRDDFLQLCQAESINLSRAELDWLTHSQALHPLTPQGRSDPYHVVQVFALSAVRPEWHALKVVEPQLVRQKLDAAIESVWARFAFLAPNGQQLNGHGWLALTQAARDQRERIAQQPAQRLWIEGLANLAAAYLFAIGVRPVAVTGRPRIAPTDPVLLALDEMVRGYYDEHQTFIGCFPFIRKGILDESDKSKVMTFVRQHAPASTANVTDEREFYQAWQAKLGTPRTLERAIDEARASLETLPDETQDAGAVFAFERMASQTRVPLSSTSIPTDTLSADVLMYAKPLADGSANSVGCWDTHHWQWWLVPRWLLRQRFAHQMLRHLSLPFARIDATAAMTVQDDTHSNE